jgi:hypothetical protein
MTKKELIKELVQESLKLLAELGLKEMRLTDFKDYTHSWLGFGYDVYFKHRDSNIEYVVGYDDDKNFIYIKRTDYS